MFDLLIEEFITMCPSNGDVFTSNIAAYDLLRRRGIVNEHNLCPSCGSVLISFNLSKYKDGFSCIGTSNICNIHFSANRNTIFESFTIKFKKILMAIYCFVFNYHIFKSAQFFNITKPTYINIIDLIISKMQDL
ncbi:hypothetical protein DMUE_5214 [Dictyocoela muelleri]|nr:hypothetical protein DMUE_5214 [Dictyocoela muelleri]